MVTFKLSKDVSKRSKAENKGSKIKKHVRIAQLNHKDVFRVSVFTEYESKTNEGGSREIKIREGEERPGYGKREVLTPPPPNRGCVDCSYNYI